MAIRTVTNTLCELLERNALQVGNQPALIEERQVLSHREYFERAVRIAGALRKRGVRSQDRVAFLMPNGIGAVCLFAAAEVGGKQSVQDVFLGGHA